MISPSSTLRARDSTVGAVLTLPPQLALLHTDRLSDVSALGRLLPVPLSPLALPVPKPHRCLQTAPLTAFSSASQRALAGSSLSSTASCMTRGPRREMTAPSSGSLRMWWPWALVTRGTSRDFSRYSQHPWFGQLTNGFRLGPPLYPCLICIVELGTEDFRFAGGPFGRLEASQLDREEALLEAHPGKHLWSHSERGHLGVGLGA